MNEHAPGWYDHDGERRYWDGEQWTHSTSVPQIPAPAPYGEVAAYGQPGPYGGQAPPFVPGMMPVPRKEPGLMVLASFFIPGLGSMLNGDVGAGVAFLCAYLFSIVFAVCGAVFIVGFVGLPVAIGAWIWSMVHAYQGAVRYNQLAGYPA